MFRLFHSKCWHWVSVLSALALLLVFSMPAGATEDEVSAINQAIKEKGARWTAGVTSLMRLSPEQRRGRLGLIKPIGIPEQGLAPAEPSTTGEALALANTFDWRAFNGSDNYVTGVRDQGNCGSCWAFATTAALESSVLIFDKNPGGNADFAEQVLVSCNNNGAGNCGGGYIDRASNYIRDIGLPAESCFPYLAKNSPCYACSSYQVDTRGITSWAYIGGTVTPSVDAIKNALVTHGPLVTTMEVYDDFFSYNGGVYSHVTGNLAGAHAIAIVGYDETNQCFICKNSWGLWWGEGGFFKIAYSQLNNEVKFGQYSIYYVGKGATPPPASCTYTVSPISQSVPKTGGSYQINVGTTGTDCSWTATKNVGWITITSPSSVTGTGQVTYTVSPNSSRRNRTGNITITAITGQNFAQTVKVTQRFK